MKFILNCDSIRIAEIRLARPKAGYKIPKFPIFPSVHYVRKTKYEWSVVHFKRTISYIIATEYQKMVFK